MVVNAPVLKARLVGASQAAIVHLLVSLLVAGSVALLVFAVWFVSPFRELSGGTELFWLIIGVDVVCGPLLTLVVFNATKTRRELIRDLALVGGIQLLALGYGVHTLSYVRPLALVHEVDRFRMVSFADLDEADAHNAPAWARPLGFASPRTVGLRKAASSDEKFASVDAALQGVEPSQRPSWWQDYALSTAQVLQRAQPMKVLQDKHPDQAALIDAAVARALANHKPGETADGAALLWLPLVSRRVTDWVVLLDPVTARIRGFGHLDGF